MVISQFKLERLNSSGVVQKGIKFHYATATDDSIMFNNVSMPSAGLTSDNNFAVNFGYKRLLRVDFVLANDGTDKSVTGDSKITITDQWRYIMDTVLQGFVANEQYKTKFKATIYSDGSTWSVTGNIEDFNVKGYSNGGNMLEGSFTLFVSALIS